MSNVISLNDYKEKIVTTKIVDNDIQSSTEILVSVDTLNTWLKEIEKKSGNKLSRYAYVNSKLTNIDTGEILWLT